MKLNLQKIIEAPGEIPFSFEMDMSDTGIYYIISYLTPVKVKGRVVNSVGVLMLEAQMDIRALCRCDRCSKEYEDRKKLKISAVLSNDPQSEENPDVFMLEDGDSADLGEILRTKFILEMDTKFLCREDCKGICPKCGRDLNEGPCKCKPDIDPRLAVLEQLLDK
jgi:uncharacterized protein